MQTINLENYTREKLTINLTWANIFGILIIFPVSLIYGLPYYIVWKDKFTLADLSSALFGSGDDSGSWSGLTIFAIIIIGIVVHELIHGIVWTQYAQNGFKSIKFGVLWKKLTPYCHCKEPLKVKQYIYGTIMPAILLGLIPAVIAVITGHSGILLFGIFFTMAAAGDFFIITLVRKEDRDSYVLDHPSEAGCYVFRKPE